MIFGGIWRTIRGLFFVWYLQGLITDFVGVGKGDRCKVLNVHAREKQVSNLASANKRGGDSIVGYFVIM